MAKIVIAELDIDIDALLKSTSDLKKEIDRLKNTQKDLAASGQSTSEAFIQNEAVLKSLNSAYASNVKAVAESGKATATQANQTEMLNLALNQEVTSISEAREQNKLLNKLRNETNVTTEEGRMQLEALNQKLNENNDFIKENADAYLQQKINIGNYSDSIKEAAQSMNPLNGGIQGFTERSQEAGGVMPLLSNGLKGVISGIGGMIKASLAFIATPVGAVLAAIVVAFTLVKNAMNRSEDSTNKVTKIFSIFSGIVNKLLKALEPLGEFIIDYIVKYLDTMGKAAEKAAGLVSGALKMLGFKETAKAVDGYVKSTKASIQASKNLADAEARLEKQQRMSSKVQLDYQKDAEKLRQIRDNENLTIRERIKANDDLGAVLKKQLDEELKIAKLALQVANARINAEGKTKEALNAQAEALTTISDIQERITGQESEQIVNRVSLQKEAAEKQKEAAEKAAERQNKIIDAQIAKSKEEIELFKAQQGFKVKSTQEQYDFNKKLYDKELADLKLNYDKGKISKLQYETEKLNISNDYAQKTAELIIAEGLREIELIRENSKLSINEKLKAEMDFAQLRLEQGLINEQQYQDEITKLQNDAKKQREDKALEDQQKEKERKIIDLENERANNQLTFEEDVEIQKRQNEIKMNEELVAAEKSGADTNLIKAKYTNLSKSLDKSVEDAKIQGAINTFAQIANLLGEQSAIGKAFAITQTILAGIQGVQNAYTTAQKSPITLLNPAYPYIQAGLAGAFSAVQVGKIAGVKFEQGGIQEIGGKRHSAGGTKFYGEDGTMFEAERGEGIGILNRGAYAAFMDFNNQFGSGKSGGGMFAGGGIITQGVRPQSQDTSFILDAISSMPAPVVAVQEIQTVGNRYVNVVANADF
jgi:hypothetical protein